MVKIIAKAMVYPLKKLGKMPPKAVSSMSNKCQDSFEEKWEPIGSRPTLYTTRQIIRLP